MRLETKIERERVVILDLMERGVLKKNPGGGRSTSYDFADI